MTTSTISNRRAPASPSTTSMSLSSSSPLTTSVKSLDVTDRFDVRGSSTAAGQGRRARAEPPLPAVVANARPTHAVGYYDLDTLLRPQPKTGEPKAQLGVPANPFGAEPPALPKGIPADNEVGGGPYARTEPGYHHYTTVNQVAPPGSNISAEQMREYLQRFAVPGQDPNTLTQDGQLSTAVDPRNPQDPWKDGPVQTHISDDGLTVVNTTLPGHPLHAGRIMRTAVQNEDGSWAIKTTGWGNNDPLTSGSDAAKDILSGAAGSGTLGLIDAAQALGVPQFAAARINELEGRGIFNHVDEAMAAWIREHHPAS